MLPYCFQIDAPLLLRGGAAESEGEYFQRNLKRARQELNLRPLAPEASALSAELRALDAANCLLFTGVRTTCRETGADRLADLAATARILPDTPLNQLTGRVVVAFAERHHLRVDRQSNARVAVDLRPQRALCVTPDRRAAASLPMDLSRGARRRPASR
jgi:hypothetical protein